MNEKNGKEKWSLSKIESDKEPAQYAGMQFVALNMNEKIAIKRIRAS